jgi:hypothetical protein
LPTCGCMIELREEGDDDLSALSFSVSLYCSLARSLSLFSLFRLDNSFLIVPLVATAPMRSVRFLCFTRTTGPSNSRRRTETDQRWRRRQLVPQQQHRTRNPFPRYKLASKVELMRPTRPVKKVSNQQDGHSSACAHLRLLDLLSPLLKE